MDGNLTGTFNPVVQAKKDGAKSGGKEEKERVALLEQQLKVERERRDGGEDTGG
jgi:hypothetical protein